MRSRRAGGIPAPIHRKSAPRHDQTKLPSMTRYVTEFIPERILYDISGRSKAAGPEESNRLSSDYSKGCGRPPRYHSIPIATAPRAMA